VLHGGPVAAVRASSEGSTPSDAVLRTIGRYALHAEIASGGMATVHLGRLLGPVGFARTVAIKRLHPPLAKDPEFVAMFLDEARLAARIRHPNVVSTLDVVATEGELFVVMEYVPGESLARLLRAVRTNKEMVPVPIATTIMVGVLHGLHAAHEARDERGEPLRIVHRDVSPHNILVGTDGDAHVIDFGIAKARGRMQVTRQGQIKGKLSYMPSEQLLGKPLDHRADIFAASIVLWEALSGQRLFQGTDDGDIYAKVLLGKVDPPSLHAPGLSPEIDAIVLKGLARDREERYATAREMAMALEAATPLAPPSQVGRWVEELVGDSLAERTEQIAGIERLADGSDGRDPGGTSSALMTIAGGAPSPANDLGGRGGFPTRSLLEATGPTQPHVADAAQATVVDRIQVIAPPDDSLAAVSGVPRRSSRRLLVIALLLLLPLGGYAAMRMTREDTATTAPRAEARPHSTEAHGTPGAIASAGARPAGDWLPVPSAVATATSTTPATAEAAGGPGRKAPVSLAPSAHAATVHGAAAPQATDVPEVVAAPATRPAATNGSSCDPPFYIDGDGTKRYKRYCGSL
jgi:eukaryotic-like serine/threonine-protein kinase